MPKVTFLPSGAQADVDAGTALIDAARRAGVMIDLSCGGKGTCGKCLVRITGGSVETSRQDLVSGEDRVAGLVPACLSTVTGDVVVTVPDSHAAVLEGMADDTIDLSDIQALTPEALSPLTRRVCVTVGSPMPEDGLSDLDRLGRSLAAAGIEGQGRCPLSVIRKLADCLRGQEGRVAVTLAEGVDGLRVMDIEPGHDKSRNIGAAVDLGTTTVSLQLVDLESGQALSAGNGYNGQIRCGLDVISRINYAAGRERLDDLRAQAAGTINRLVREAAEAASVSMHDISCMSISGNTVMTHLLMGLKPEYIRLHPYTPTVLDVPEITAGSLDIDIHPEAPVLFSPSVGSYVGGDVTSGILVTDLAGETGDICLFIDIGTNGEIVLGNADFLMTCACSAGPAFEGGGIECGMRAGLGAIDHALIDQETGKASFSVIGGGRPCGICGSGLIDLVSGLFAAGLVDASGKLDRTGRSPFIRMNGRRASYTIVEGGLSKSGKDIGLSENDIENFMRAKAAIYSAASVLLKQAGIFFCDLSKLYVAGGFGKFLNIENAVSLGLLPDIPPEKFVYLGNASLTGTRLCLLSERYRNLRDRVKGRMTYIDLSTMPGYMDEYTAALFLPHTDLHHFPSVQKKLESLR